MSKVYAKLRGWAEMSGPRDRMYVKEIVRAGEYVKGDVRFDITVDVLKHWAKTFAAMKRNGIKVPIPVGHDGAGNPELNRGWVDSMYVDGESLFMIAEASDDEAAKTFMRSDVSVYSPEKTVDGQGRTYTRPIEHVALCTDPVVSGLGRFIPLAASMEGKKMDWKKLAEALGITDEVTDGNAHDLITKRFAAMKSELDELKKTVKASNADPKDDDEGDDDKPPVKASANKRARKEPDPLLVEMASDNRKMRIEKLVTERRITPAQAKKLTEQFIGEENRALVASIKEGREKEFDRAVEILASNEPISKGERSGAQTMSLSDPNKSDNLLLKDADARAKSFAASAR